MKRAALLKDPSKPESFTVRMQLQEGRWATFQYSDPQMARDHYDVLRTTGVIGGFYIREISFDREVKS